MGWFDALCITVPVTVGLWNTRIVMFNRIEQIISTQGTKPARGTAVSPLETDSGQSHKQRADTAAKIKTMSNHIAIEQE